MKKINWVLPYKNEKYLEALAGEFETGELVRLIVGIQDVEGKINDCNLHILEDNATDERILLTGATLGAHTITYAFLLEKLEKAQKEFKEVIEKHIDDDCIGNDIDDDIDAEEEVDEIVYNLKEDNFFDFYDDDLFAESKVRTLLREILSHFKK
jgi:hypothetical protein